MSVGQSSVPPLISICVATRNRAAYLKHCLGTILNQDFLDYEIVVSENSDPEDRIKAKAVIDEIGSSRIRYFEQPSPVSMTANFETAVGLACGEYCMCLGDDDGLVEGGLAYVADILRSEKPSVVKCPLAFYFWPGSAAFPLSLVNVPMNRALNSVVSSSLLAKVARCEMPYIHLPMIYYGLIKRTLIERIVSAQGSFFADSTSIDMYSGMTVAALTKSFLVLDRPFCIAGLSSQSNGEMFLTGRKGKIMDAYIREHNLLAQYRAVKLPMGSINAMVLLEIDRLRRNFPEETVDIRPSREEAFIRCSGLQGPVETKGFLKRAKTTAEAFREADPDTNWLGLVSNLRTSKYLLFPRGMMSPPYVGQMLAINPGIFRCDNVEEASSFIGRLNRGEVIALEPSGFEKARMWLSLFKSNPVIRNAILWAKGELRKFF